MNTNIPDIDVYDETQDQFNELNEQNDENENLEGINVSQQGNYIWGTNIQYDLIKDKITKFFEREENNAILEHAKFNDINHIDLKLNQIKEYDEELYKCTVEYPTQLLHIFDVAINDLGFDEIQVRVYGFEESKKIRNLSPNDIERLVSVKGMVTRIGNIIPTMKNGFFKCSYCDQTLAIPTDIRNTLSVPPKCPNCKKRDTLQMIHTRSDFMDTQIIKLQESPESISEGETPQTLHMIAYDSLVDAAKPGDRIEVTGVYRADAVKIGISKRTVRSIFRSYIDVIHIQKYKKEKEVIMDFEEEMRNCKEKAEIENYPENLDKMFDVYTAFTGDEKDLQNNETARTMEKQEIRKWVRDIEEYIDEKNENRYETGWYKYLIDSLAPSITEMDDVKKGLLCQLFGGTTKSLTNNQKLRGDINILMIGDPGTSKSQLLTFMHKVAPRGMYTSGRGSSAVGLTAFVGKSEEGGTVLESGALVMSDKGLCCIDEFDKMTDMTRSVLHEAMEQQTISIAKSGIVCSLNARTAILASANPKESRYNPKLSIMENISMIPSLLSRFDLIYIILDKPDEERDRKLAKHIISLYWGTQERKEVLDISKFTSFVRYARKNIKPVLTNGAKEELVEGYLKMRSLGSESKASKKTVTATTRQLESLIRMSEALAKMELRPFVIRDDVREAIRLVNVGIHQAATNPNTGLIDYDLIQTGKTFSD